MGNTQQTQAASLPLSNMEARIHVKTQELIDHYTSVIVSRAPRGTDDLISYGYGYDQQHIAPEQLMLAETVFTQPVNELVQEAREAASFFWRHVRFTSGSAKDYGMPAQATAKLRKDVLAFQAECNDAALFEVLNALHYQWDAACAMQHHVPVTTAIRTYVLCRISHHLLLRLQQGTDLSPDGARTLRGLLENNRACSFAGWNGDAGVLAEHCHAASLAWVRVKEVLERSRRSIGDKYYGLLAKLGQGANAAQRRSNLADPSPKPGSRPREEDTTAPSPFNANGVGMQQDDAASSSDSEDDDYSKRQRHQLRHRFF